MVSEGWDECYLRATGREAEALHWWFAQGLCNEPICSCQVLSLNIHLKVKSFSVFERHELRFYMEMGKGILCC